MKFLDLFTYLCRWADGTVQCWHKGRTKGAQFFFLCLTVKIHIVAPKLQLPLQISGEWCLLLYSWDALVVSSPHTIILTQEGLLSHTPSLSHSTLPSLSQPWDLTPLTSYLLVLTGSHDISSLASCQHHLMTPPCHPVPSGFFLPYCPLSQSPHILPR